MVDVLILVGSFFAVWCIVAFLKRPKNEPFSFRGYRNVLRKSFAGFIDGTSGFEYQCSISLDEVPQRERRTTQA